MFPRQLGAVKRKSTFLVQFRPNMQFRVFPACSSLKHLSMVICSCAAKLDLSRTIELPSALSSLGSENEHFWCDLANLCSFRSLLLEVTKTVLSALKSFQFATP